MDTQRMENRSIVAACMAAAAAVWLGACADVPPGGATTAPMPRAGAPEFILPSEAPRAGPLPRPGGTLGPQGSPADPQGRTSPSAPGGGLPPGATPPSPAAPAGGLLEAAKAGTTPMPNKRPPDLPPAPGRVGTDPSAGRTQGTLETGNRTSSRTSGSGAATTAGCTSPPCPQSAVFGPAAGPSPPAKPNERVGRFNAVREVTKKSEVAAPAKAMSNSKPAAAAPIAESKQRSPAVQVDRAKTLERKQLAPGG